jgi:hypothetical protein
MSDAFGNRFYRLYSSEGECKEFLWNNSLEEAVNRMKDHLFATKPIRFDARDYGALAYIIDTIEELDR